MGYATVTEAIKSKAEKANFLAHILLASIPKGKEMKGTVCGFKTSTSHLMVHTPQHLKNTVRMVIRLRNTDFSLSELVKLDAMLLKETWLLYRLIFNTGVL